MHLIPTDEQRHLTEAAAEFLRNEMSTALIRERRGQADAVPGELWAAAAELGLLGLGLAEKSGGLGAGLVEESLVFREIGRIPSPGPFLSSTLGARVAAQAADIDLAEKISSGRTPVGLGLLRPGARLDSDGLTGDVDLVDVTEGGLALMLTRDAVALVDTSAVGRPTTVEAIDPAMRLATAAFRSVAPLHFVRAADEPLHLRATVLTAALLTGVAEGALAASVQHAKVREQFGRPIGVNQAVKHRCAEMALHAEAAASQTSFAAAAFDGSREDAAFHATAAMVMAGHAARENAAANVQLHGGMGFTAEDDAHLYVKRAEVLGHVTGGREVHLARLLELPRPE